MKVPDIFPPRSDVVIRLPRTVPVDGRVVDVGDKALPHALVNVRDQDGCSPQAISEVEGRFRVEVVPGAILELEGGWTALGADGQGLRRLVGKLADVVAGSGEIVLRLE